MSIPLRRVLGALLVLSVAACSETPTVDPDPDVLGALRANADYATFVELATETGVLPELDGSGPFTVLAPTDIAFNYLGADVRPILTLPAQRPLLTRILRHHIISGRLAPEDFTDGAVFTSLTGETLAVRRVGDVVLVDGATIDLDEIKEADNGVVYPASNVIRTNLTARERIELAPTLSVFARFAESVGVLRDADALPEVTILVPTNDAFEAIEGTAELLGQATNADVLRRVIGPHVLPGRIDLETLSDGAEVQTLDGQVLRVANTNGILTIGDARILREAIKTSDGQIYLLQNALFAGISLADRVRIQPMVSVFPSRIQEEPDIWARMNNVDDALTVFAPIDGAYVRQNGEVTLALSFPENANLLSRTRRVLVVEGRYAFEDLTHNLELQALDGSTLRVARDGNNVFVGSRRVTPTGSEASNGVFYTANDFIQPTVDPLDSAILAGHTIFGDAVRRAGLETFVRSSSLSTFPPINGAFNEQPGVLSRGDLAGILRYHITEADLPLFLQETSFTMLNGATRDIQLLPFDRSVAPFLDGETRVVGGRNVLNGQGRLFAVDSLILPPAQVIQE
ncbi:MAG: fasciclin domain-containing protein [Bacteroidota bacterium]